MISTECSIMAKSHERPLWPVRELCKGRYLRIAAVGADRSESPQPPFLRSHVSRYLARALPIRSSTGTGCSFACRISASTWLSMKSSKSSPDTSDIAARVMNIPTSSASKSRILAARFASITSLGKTPAQFCRRSLPITASNCCHNP